MDNEPKASWTTKNEQDFVTRLATAEENDIGEPITLDDRIFRLESWLKTSESRVWGSKVDVGLCKDIANGWLFVLRGARDAKKPKWNLV